MRELISTKKKKRKKAQAGNELSNILPKSWHAGEKGHQHHHTPHVYANEVAKTTPLLKTMADVLEGPSLGLLLDCNLFSLPSLVVADGLKQKVYFSISPREKDLYRIRQYRI